MINYDISKHKFSTWLYVFFQYLTFIVYRTTKWFSSILLYHNKYTTTPAGGRSSMVPLDQILNSRDSNPSSENIFCSFCPFTVSTYKLRRLSSGCQHKLLSISVLSSPFCCTVKSNSYITCTYMYLHVCMIHFMSQCNTTKIGGKKWSAKNITNQYKL